MTPTNELRFVARTEIEPVVGTRYEKVRNIRVLQQKWVEVRSYDVHWTEPPDYEWRDVPLVKEDV